MFWRPPVPAVPLSAPNDVKVTLRPSKAQSNLWMLPLPTARKFCPPPLPQDAMTGIFITCWRCEPHALATPWLILQLLARHQHTPTAHATLEQHRWLHTHFEPALANMLGMVTLQPNIAAEWRIQRGTFRTKRCPLNYPVPAKHRRTAPEAPVYPAKHLCSREGRETQTIKWTTYHLRRAYLLEYIHNYLIQGHERKLHCVEMNAAAMEIIHQGIGVYVVPRIGPAITTPWPTTAGAARVHAYQPTAPCCLPRPDDQNTIIFADASSRIGLRPAADGAALELRPEKTGQLRQHNLTGTTIFKASWHGGLKTLAIIVDAVTPISKSPRDQPHHVLVVIDAAVDFQIVRRLDRQPLHKATNCSLGTQALHLWVALQNLPGHIVFHLIKQESHRYNLGNRHINLHAHNQLAEHVPTPDEPPLHDHMHTQLQHLPRVPQPGHHTGCPTTKSTMTRDGHTTTHSSSEPWPTSRADTPTTPSYFASNRNCKQRCTSRP